MSLDPRQLRDLVVRPALEHIGLWSIEAEMLVMGTAAQESQLRYLKQIKGPALGLWQMEPATHDDIWANFLTYRAMLAGKLAAVVGQSPPGAAALATNLWYGAAMCRVHYHRFREPAAHLPIGDLASVWKYRYNSALGAGKPEDFIRNWRLVADLYPEASA